MAIIHRVRAVSTGWTGGPGLNTFYFREGAGTTGDQAVAQLGVDRVRAAFFALADAYPQMWSLRVDPVVDALNDTNGSLVASFSTTPPAVVAGISATAFGPIPAMLLLSLKTSGVVQGRRVIGRAFLGPTKQATDADGTPSSGVLGQVAAFGAALLDKGVTGPDVVVWSRPIVQLPPPAPVVTTRVGSSHIVSSVLVRDRYAVLRSRRD